MKLFHNRTVLGVLCIAISLLICFLITPLVNRGLSNKTEIVRMKTGAAAGEQITKDMIEVVSVGKYNLPSDVITKEEDVVGKYLTAELYAGDYILSEKITDEPAIENAYLYSLNGSKQAMSITINTFAEGVSGKLKSGDIVSVIVSDYLGTGKTVIPTELKYVEVIAVTAKSGYDANTDDVAEVSSDSDDDKELPSTVTILVTPEQSKLLAQLEAEYEMHLSLVYRGSDETSAEFIAAEDEALEQLKAEAEYEELLEEAQEQGYVIDSDGDGIPDARDTDGDGGVDLIDTDGDGYPDTIDGKEHDDYVKELAISSIIGN